MNQAQEVTQRPILDDSAVGTEMNLAQLFISFFIYYEMDEEINIINSALQFHPNEDVLGHKEIVELFLSFLCIDKQEIESLPVKTAANSLQDPSFSTEIHFFGGTSPDCVNRGCFHDPCPTDVIQKEILEDQFPQDLKPRPSGQMLLKAVLNWNFSIIRGPSLLPQNPRPIPLQFQSSNEWFNTFYPFILEDLRCRLRGLIESYGLDGEIRVLHPLIRVGYQSNDSLVPGSISFNIKNDSEKVFIANNASGLAIFFRGNIMNLKDKKLEDLLTKPEHFLVHIGRCIDPLNHPHRFECQFPNKSFLRDLQASSCHGWRLIILGSHLAAPQRVCGALGRRVCPLFMKDILYGEVTEDTMESPENQRAIGDLSCMTSLQSLNESQKIAILKVLQVGLPHHPRIQIIKGPPGC